MYDFVTDFSATVRFQSILIEIPDRVHTLTLSHSLTSHTRLYMCAKFHNLVHACCRRPLASTFRARHRGWSARSPPTFENEWIIVVSPNAVSSAVRLPHSPGPAPDPVLHVSMSPCVCVLACVAAYVCRCEWCECVRVRTTLWTMIADDC